MGAQSGDCLDRPFGQRMSIEGHTRPATNVSLAMDGNEVAATWASGSPQANEYFVRLRPACRVVAQAN